jgi:hypothetical protein
MSCSTVQKGFERGRGKLLGAEVCERDALAGAELHDAVSGDWVANKV